MRTIRQLREERGWTQRELAHKIGVTSIAISNWERGKHEPRASQLRALARVFEVPMDEIDFESPLQEDRDVVVNHPGEPAQNAEREQTSAEFSVARVTKRFGSYNTRVSVTDPETGERIQKVITARTRRELDAAVAAFKASWTAGSYDASSVGELIAPDTGDPGQHAGNQPGQ